MGVSLQSVLDVGFIHDSFILLNTIIKGFTQCFSLLQVLSLLAFGTGN